MKAKTENVLRCHSLLVEIAMDKGTMFIVSSLSCSRKIGPCRSTCANNQTYESQLGLKNYNRPQQLSTPLFAVYVLKVSIQLCQWLFREREYTKINFICAKETVTLRTTLACALTFNSINRQTTVAFDVPSREM